MSIYVKQSILSFIISNTNQSLFITLFPLMILNYLISLLLDHRQIHRYHHNIQLLHIDFEEVLQRVPRGGFVYLDPPYDPVSDTASFTGYNRGGFGREE